MNFRIQEIESRIQNKKQKLLIGVLNQTLHFVQSDFLVGLSATK